MPVAFPIRGTWRIDTPQRRLAVALLASLLIHALLFGIWKIAPKLDFLQRAIAHKLVRAEPAKSHLQDARRMAKESPPPETPLVFVEVDPALAAAEPPRETKYYSTHNAVAANPDAAKKADVPKLDGTQTKVVRMTDNLRPQRQPLQPTPPRPAAPKPEEKTVEPVPPAKEAPSAPIGDLTMVKVDPKPRTNPAENPAPPQEPKPHRKPRTVREALQRNPALAGQAMQQDGGVQRRAHVGMVDVKGSPFGDYDYQFIRAVEQRWYHLLDNNQYMLDRQGKVVLGFRLHSDGRITHLEVESNSVGDILCLLCQKAILDPAPFPKWPIEMRRLVTEDYREVRFTFYYD